MRTCAIRSTLRASSWALAWSDCSETFGCLRSTLRSSFFSTPRSCPRKKRFCGEHFPRNSRATVHMSRGCFRNGGHGARRSQLSSSGPRSRGRRGWGSCCSESTPSCDWRRGYGRCRRCQRKPDDDARAVSLLAFGSHRAAMCENNVFHDGKAEAGPAALAAAGFVGAVKAFKNPRQIRWRYPDPGVLDPDFDGTVHGRGAHFYAATGFGVLDGIVDKVAQHLFETKGIRTDFRQTGRHFGSQGDFFLGTSQ